MKLVRETLFLLYWEVTGNGDKLWFERSHSLFLPDVRFHCSNFVADHLGFEYVLTIVTTVPRSESEKFITQSTCKVLPGENI